MTANWTIKELVLWTTAYFSEKGIKQPRLEAEVLLAHVLGRDRVYIYANYDAPTRQNERDVFRHYIKRRVNGEPLAYITGHREFMSLDFTVNPAVLIPRPDTEILVESVINTARSQDGIRIIDVGTGSGAIAVSLAYYLPRAEILATDISKDALEIAEFNAKKHGVTVNFHQGDLLEPFNHDESFEPFDYIVANLPYITQSEFTQLDKEVRDFEPGQALLAPGDGLDIYRRLLQQAPEYLKPQGCLVFEIGAGQGDAARKMFADIYQLELVPDLAGRDRVIIARKKV